MSTFGPTFDSTFSANSADISYLEIQNDPTLWTNGNHALGLLDLRHSSIPQGFWDSCEAGGGNIRVFHYDADTDTEKAVACHVVSFDKSAKKGAIYFDASDSSANSQNTWRVKTPAGLSTVAKTDPLGQYKVWENFQYAWLMESLTPEDATGNGYDATQTVGSPTLQDGLIGQSVNFDGSSAIALPPLGTYLADNNNGYAIFSTVKIDDYTTESGIFRPRASLNMGNNMQSDGRFRTYIWTGSTLRSTNFQTAKSTSEWYHGMFRHDSINTTDGMNCRVNKNPPTFTEDYDPPAGPDTTKVDAIGAVVDDTYSVSNVPTKGSIDNVRVYDGIPTDDFGDTDTNLHRQNETVWATVTWNEATQTESGGASSSVVINSSAGGFKSASGGAEAGLGISSESLGVSKEIQDGSEGSLVVTANGAGYKVGDLSPPEITGQVAYNIGTSSNSINAQFGFDTITENPDAESYEVRYNGEIATIGISNFNSYRISESDFNTVTLPRDAAINIEIRTVIGSNKGPWSSPEEVYVIPLLPDPVDESTVNIDSDANSATVSFTEPNLADGAQVFVYKVSDGSFASAETVGPVPSGSISPVAVDGLDDNTDYEVEVGAINYSSHTNDIYVTRNNPERVSFTTLQSASRGATATLGISSTSGLSKKTTLGANSSIYFSASAGVVKETKSGAIATLYISATGSGGGRHVTRGAEATMSVTANASGKKEVTLGAESPIILDVEGAGNKSVVISSESTVLLSDSSAVFKTVRTGEESSVVVATAGDGRKQVLSGAQADVILSAIGAGTVGTIDEIAKINITLKQAGIKGLFNKVSS